jgi:hypothetical protein
MTTAVLVAVAVAGGVAVAVAVPVAVAVAVANRTPFNADVVATAGTIVYPNCTTTAVFVAVDVVDAVAVTVNEGENVGVSEA